MGRSALAHQGGADAGGVQEIAHGEGDPAPEAPLTPIHGTRAAYQAPCHCDRCRAAEATYRAQLRSLHAHGRVTLNQLVSAVEARRLVRSLQADGLLSRPAIATAIGVTPRTVRLVTPTTTWRTTLKLRRLARLKLGER